MKKTLLIALIAGACSTLAQAQSTPTAAPASATAAPSAAKAALLQRIVALQQLALENTARSLGEQPLRQLIGAAQMHMANVPEDKRQSVVAQLQGMTRKYEEDLGPLSKEAAAKVGPTALTPVFDKNFSEDELRQLVTALESPVYKKYLANMPELQNATTERLVTELRPTIEPRIESLKQNMAAALGVSPNGEGAPAPAKKPAAKPKK